jgi:hypothetical protein
VNVISFSLFGDIPRYCRGAISNARLVPVIYPNWSMWVYHDDSVPTECVDELKSLGVNTIDKTDCGLHRYIWRFLAHDAGSKGRFIVRDCDSRLNVREKAAVDAWMSSDTDWHVMRDHPHHTDTIMAGMWGGKLMALGTNIEPILRQYKSQHTGYGYDQRLIKTLFWQRMWNSVTIHDSNQAKYVFPTPRGDRFVGETYNEHDDPVQWTPNMGLQE